MRAAWNGELPGKNSRFRERVKRQKKKSGNALGEKKQLKIKCLCGII